MTKMMPALVYGLMAAVLLFAGYLFFLGGRNIWRGVASPHWPKTAGVVAVSETSSALTVDSDTSRNNIDYKATISFRYNVNSRAYTTDLLYFGFSAT